MTNQTPQPFEERPLPDSEAEIEQLIFDIMALGTDHSNDDPAPQNHSEAVAAIQQMLVGAELRGALSVAENLNIHRLYGMDYQDSLDAINEANDKRIAFIKSKRAELQQSSKEGEANG